VNRVVLAGVVVVAGAAAVGAAAGLAGRSASATPPSIPTSTSQVVDGLKGDAVWAPGKRPAPGFTLTDQSGRKVSLSALDNRPVLLTFLDATCRNQCPIAGRQLGDAVSRLHGTEPPAIVVVDVNPLEDTPANERAFAAHQHWTGTRWYWLNGSRAKLSAVWKTYGIEVVTKRYIVQGSAPIVNVTHTIAVYLVSGGDVRAAFLPPLEPNEVAGDVRVLEGSGA